MRTIDSDARLRPFVNSLSGTMIDPTAVWILKTWNPPELAFWRRLPQGAILGIGIRVFGW